jgi:membrane magnesium transporter 1
LPLDIQIETLASVALASFGFVLGSDRLKPVSWSTWAGKIEREGQPNPFQYLENRVGFMDIRVSSDESVG